MRPITKIFILLGVGVLIFLLWPRSPSMGKFKPEELAELRVRAWNAEKNQNDAAAFIAIYNIFTSQFGFPPIAAARIAQSEISAIKHLRGYPANPVAADQALGPLREKFVLIRAETKDDIDPDACARQELAWRTLEADKQGVKSVAAAMQSLMAMRYGGDAKQYKDVALAVAGARSFIVMGQTPKDGTDQRQAAKQVAEEGYQKLHSIIGDQKPSAN